MQRAIKKLVFTFAMLPLFSASFAYSADLVQAYERALQNDPVFAGAKSLYLASRQAGKLGSAPLKPSIALVFQQTENTYKSSQDQVRFGEPGNINDCVSTQLATDITGLITCALVSSVGIEVTDSVDESFNEQDTLLRVEQPIINMPAWHEYRAAEASELVGEAKFEAAQLDLIVRVAEAYFGVLRAINEYEFAKKEEEYVNRQHRLLRKEYEQGLRRETSLYDAQSRLEAQKIQRIVANSGVQQAYRLLAAVTGVFDDDLRQLTPEMPVEIPQPSDPDEWMKKALARNAKLISARHEVTVAHQTYKKIRAGHLPVVKFGAIWHKVDQSGGEGELPGGEQTRYGLEITVPLFSGGAISAGSARAAYEHQSKKDELTGTRWKIEAETLNLLGKVNTDVVGYLAQQRVISSTNNALRATRKSYRDGSRTILELFDARSRGFRAQKDLWNARFDYALDTLKLKQAAGILSREDLVSLNKWLDHAE